MVAETAPAWCPPGLGAPQHEAWALGPGKAARPGCLRNPARGATGAQWLSSPGRAEVAVSGCRPSRHQCPPSAPASLPPRPRLPPQTPPRGAHGTCGVSGGNERVSGGPPYPRRAPLPTSCTHSREAAVSPGVGGESPETRHPFWSGFRDRLPGASPSGLPGADSGPPPSVTGHTGRPGRDLQGGRWGLALQRGAALGRVALTGHVGR